MKKLITIICTLLLLSPLTASAVVEENNWIYVFHLQYQGEKLSINSEEKAPYDPVPMIFSSSLDPKETDFYGIVVNIKNKEEARFGFNKPTTVVAATGKSLFDVRAPYYADADHVSFYSRDGKHLLDISVSGSSFCDDNNKCNTEVGENYINCPADCPPPPPTPGTPVVSPVVPLSVEPVPNPTPITVTPPGIDTSYTEVHPGGGQTNDRKLSTKGVLSLVGGILLILLSYVLYRVRKNME